MAQEDQAKRSKCDPEELDEAAVDRKLRITLKKLHIATAERLLRDITESDEVTAGMIQAAVKMCKDNNQTLKQEDTLSIPSGPTPELPDADDLPFS